VLDVSEKAAKALGMHGNGTARIRLHTVDAKGHPAPVDPAAAQGDPYTIQVAALADPANIARLSKELRSTIGVVNLQEAHAKGGATIQRVRVGSYTKLDDAKKAAETIAKLFKDRGLEPFITVKSSSPFLVIAAGGQGTRMGGGSPNSSGTGGQDPAGSHGPDLPGARDAGLGGIALAVPGDRLAEVGAWTFGLPTWVVAGGTTRQASVALALAALPDAPGPPC